MICPRTTQAKGSTRTQQIYPYKNTQTFSFFDVHFRRKNKHRAYCQQLKSDHVHWNKQVTEFVEWKQSKRWSIYYVIITAI